MGFREGTCGAQTQRIHCKVPCNWKKEFGGEVEHGRRAGKQGMSLIKLGQEGQPQPSCLSPWGHSPSHQPTANTSLRAGGRVMGALAPKPAKGP